MSRNAVFDKAFDGASKVNYNYDNKYNNCK